MKAAVKDDVNRLIGRRQAAFGFAPANTPALARFAPRIGLSDRRRLLDGRGPAALRFAESLRGLRAGDFRRQPRRMADLLGRKPIKRPLPHQRDVLTSRHLRSAEHRLAAVRLPESQRQQLSRSFTTPLSGSIRLAGNFVRSWPMPWIWWA